MNTLYLKITERTDFGKLSRVAGRGIHIPTKHNIIVVDEAKYPEHKHRKFAHVIFKHLNNDSSMVEYRVLDDMIDLAKLHNLTVYVNGELRSEPLVEVEKTDATE